MSKAVEFIFFSRRFLAIGLSLLWIASGATAQDRPRGDRPRFDIRSVLATTQPTASKADEVNAQREQRTDLQQRLAATGVPLRYSLDGGARLKMLSSPAGALTAATTDDAETVALDWLRANQDLFGLTDEDLASASVTTELSSTGLKFVNVEQVVNGLPVFESTLRVAVNSQGSIVQVQGSQAGRVTAVTPHTDAGPAAAIQSAFAAVGVSVEGQAERIDSESAEWITYSNPEPELPAVVLRRVAFPLGDGAALAAYRIVATTSAGGYEIIVAADSGRMLYRLPLESHLGQARVWPQSPVHGDRELFAFGEGWLPEGGQTTVGNNADAYLDTDGDQLPDRITQEGLRDGRAFSENQTFDFPSGDGFEDPALYQANSVTHAFYHANAAHDHFYALGFREVDGNFQTSNFGKGGKGNDAVKLLVQSSEELSNASFLVTPDGTPGRMRLGVGFLDGYRDMSLSASTIFHEYTHGVTARLVGGPLETTCLMRGPQGDGLAEGWSDYFAASRFNQPVYGEYISGNAVTGIRRYRLDQMPWRYSDLGNEGLQAHQDGEILSGVLWDIRSALGAEAADQLIFSALTLTPCQPSFVDVRDAILTADETFNGGENLQALWTVFAARGLGAGSRGEDFSGPPLVTRFDSTKDLPAEFGGVNRSPVVSSQPTDVAIVGETATYTVHATDPEGDSWTVEMLEGPSGAIFESAARRVRWRPSFTSGRFVFSVKDSNGNETRHGFVWFTFSIITLQNSLRIDGPAGSSGVVGVFVEDPIPLLQFTTREGQGDPDLVVWPPFAGEFTATNPFTSDETITVADPDPGPWLIFVDGISDYSNVRLRARAVTPTNVTTQGPVNVSDAETSERIFRFVVPADAEYLHVQTSGGSGDADLLVARGRVPLCPSYSSVPCDDDGFSETDGNYESVEIENPEAGEWFITVAGFTSYQGVSLRVSTTPAPKLLAATEGAAFQPILAPGGIATLFGEGFTDAGVEATASSLPLPTELAGIRVLVNGVFAPLFYVSEKQINFQNPFESRGLSADILVQRNGVLSKAFEADVDRDVPRFFTFTLNEQVEPVITHADGSIVAPASPAKPGEVLIAYLTGVGSLFNPPATGAPATADPLTTTAILPTVIVNGIPVRADFSGWSPGYVGLIQVNFPMPLDLPAGTRVPIEIRYGSVKTQSLTMAVQ